MLDMLTNLEEEIPILVNKNEEDSTSYIERSFQEMKGKQKVDNCMKSLNENTKFYIDNLVEMHLNSKSKRENFYEHELMKLYKERVVFLESQVNRMGDIIANLTKNVNNASLFCKSCQHQTNSHHDNYNEQKQCDKIDNSREPSQSFVIPEITDVETPNTSFERIKENSAELIEKQLNEVRKSNHQKFMLQKKSNLQEKTVLQEKLLIVRVVINNVWLFAT